MTIPDRHLDPPEQPEWEDCPICKQDFEDCDHTEDDVNDYYGRHARPGAR